MMADKQIRQRLTYALDMMKGRLTEKPFENTDRCVLCGWSRIDLNRSGTCGRTPGSETLLRKYGIEKQWDGQHLWFSEVVDALTLEGQSTPDADDLSQFGHDKDY